MSSFPVFEVGKGQVDDLHVQKESLTGCAIAGQGSPAGFRDSAALQAAGEGHLDALLAALNPQLFAAGQKVRRAEATAIMYRMAVNDSHSRLQALCARAGNHSASSQSDHAELSRQIGVLQLEHQDAVEELDCAEAELRVARTSAESLALVAAGI